MAYKLTVKQERFCNKYLECGNASEAYRFVYDCKKMNNEVVWVKASELLSNGNVSVRINALQSKLQTKSDITKERILDELDAILDAKIIDYIDLVTEEVALPQTETQIAMGYDPQYIDVQKLVFKDFNLLTERQIRAIENVKQGRNGIELKLHGKSWTIDRICKMLGYDAPAQSEVRLMNEFEHMTDEELESLINNAEGDTD